MAGRILRVLGGEKHTGQGPKICVPGVPCDLLMVWGYRSASSSAASRCQEAGKSVSAARTEIGGALGGPLGGLATMRATGSSRESAHKHGPLRTPPSPDRQRPLHPRTAACKQPTVMCVAPIRMKLWLHAHTSHLSVNSRPKPLEMETTVEYNFRDY